MSTSTLAASWTQSNLMRMTNACCAKRRRITPALTGKQRKYRNFSSLVITFLQSKEKELLFTTGCSRLNGGKLVKAIDVIEKKQQNCHDACLTPSPSTALGRFGLAYPALLGCTLAQSCALDTFHWHEVHLHCIYGEHREDPASTKVHSKNIFKVLGRAVLCVSSLVVGLEAPELRGRGSDDNSFYLKHVSRRPMQAD